MFIIKKNTQNKKAKFPTTPHSPNTSRRHNIEGRLGKQTLPFQTSVITEHQQHCSVLGIIKTLCLWQRNSDLLKALHMLSKRPPLSATPPSQTFPFDAFQVTDVTALQ